MNESVVGIFGPTYCTPTSVNKQLCISAYLSAFTLQRLTYGTNRDDNTGEFNR